jgi:hypothetical protein
MQRDRGNKRKTIDGSQENCQAPTTVYDYPAAREVLDTNDLLKRTLANEPPNEKGIRGVPKNEWTTPPEIVEASLEVLGVIDIDPCAESKDCPNIPARAHYTIWDNGMSVHWEGRVFLNPPYGNSLARWIAYLRDEYRLGYVREAIVLVPARTDSRWFHYMGSNFIWCGVKGRLRFSEIDGPAPFPSAIFYIGKNRKRFVEIFSRFGPVYDRI